VLEALSWRCVVTLELSSRIPAGTVVWREPAGWIDATLGRGFLSYERPQGGQAVPFVRVDASKGHPKSGLVQLDWNITGSMLLARFESAPSALFIYSFPSPSERFLPKLRTVLLQQHPILHARWNPVRPGSLVLCCGDSGIYTWSNEWSAPGEGASPLTTDVAGGSNDDGVAECIGVPAKQKFEVRDVRWAPDGKGLVLMDKDMFCCAFEVSDGDEMHEADGDGD